MKTVPAAKPVRMTIRQLADDMETKREGYYGILSKAAELASEKTPEPKHMEHIAVMASDREMAVAKMHLAVDVARLAYSDGVERYQGALADQRARSSAVNSWIIAVMTIAITVATIVQAYKALHP